IPVEIRRFHGFNGDVRVTAIDTPPGIEAKPLIIPSGKTSGEMEWLAAAGSPDEPFQLKLAGAAEVNGKQVEKPVVMAQPMLGDGPGFVQLGDSTAWVNVISPVQFALDRVPPPGAGFALDRHVLSTRGDRKARVLVHL